jgi:hypothetical protein
MRFFWEMGFRGTERIEATKEKVGFAKWDLFFSNGGNVVGVHKHVKI